MHLSSLRSSVQSHSGTLRCERIGAPQHTKLVSFAHRLGEPAPDVPVPGVGRLRDFLDTFGSIVFYADEVSGDAARYLAPPAQWPGLGEDFRDGVDGLDEEERAELLPPWVEGCLVIGEVPQSGNYLLMPLKGEETGAVYLFDHDGFEFTRQAGDLIEFVERMLAPDDALLTDIASHMRFIEADPMVQWWIRELQDNRGHTARTTV